MLIGHPEHDLLFIATQVARAAGLKAPSDSVALALKYHKCGHVLKALTDKSSVSLPVDELGRKLRNNTVLFTEDEAYQMLARGHAPQSQPFRDWVFKEVLPSIRKTGQQFAGE